MEGWRTIESAPKTGEMILLTAIYDGEIFEIHPMQWMAVQRNALFPGVVGMWTAPNGAYTWNESPENGGPTHWKPVA